MKFPPTLHPPHEATNVSWNSCLLYTLFMRPQMFCQFYPSLFFSTAASPATTTELSSFKRQLKMHAPVLEASSLIWGKTWPSLSSLLIIDITYHPWSVCRYKVLYGCSQYAHAIKQTLIACWCNQADFNCLQLHQQVVEDILARRRIKKDKEVEELYLADK